MNFLCPACRTPLPVTPVLSVVPCNSCGVQVDLTRMDTAPGSAKLWPDVDLTGDKLGEYELVSRIGAGGMGAVYEAKGPAGTCAVKVLSALLAAEPGLRTRFRREAAALRVLDHEGVVRVLAEGEERGFCWYAMERVVGPDLRAHIASARLAPAEATALVKRLLAALQVVHAAGFIHRDVKPGNILMAPTGPKLCDFGIARYDGSTTLTESAAMMGSLRYMAPEQRFGRADARSDLYAVGVVLHECLAGGVPGEVDLPRGTPARLRRFIDALTKSRPDDRPADAAAALALLARRRGRTAAIAGAVAGVVLAIAAVPFMQAPKAPVLVAVQEKQAAVVAKVPAVETKAPAPNEPVAQASPQVPAAENQAVAQLVAKNEPVSSNTFAPEGKGGLSGLQGLGTKGGKLKLSKSFESSGSGLDVLRGTGGSSSTAAPETNVETATTAAVEGVRQALNSRRATRAARVQSQVAANAEPELPRKPVAKPMLTEDVKAPTKAPPEPDFEMPVGVKSKGKPTKKQMRK